MNNIFPQILKPHISLNVTNLEKSIDFYTRMLGIEPCKVRTDYAKFDISNPSLNLSLNQVKSVNISGTLSHLGLQVASTKDVMELRQKWIDSGLNISDDMQVNCCYAIQDKTWVKDPDGNEWEVFVVLEDNLPETNTCCSPT